MSHRTRGATLIELLIYSALACLACGLLAKVMIDYRVLSLIFDTRTRVTTTASLFFSQVREELFRSKGQGVYLDSDRRILTIQPLEEADAQGSVAWREEVVVFWFEPETKEVRRGLLAARELNSNYQGGRVEPEDTALRRGVASLVTSRKYRPVLKDLVRFEMSRPGLAAISIAIKIEKNSFQLKSETVERVGIFPILVEQDI